MRQLRYKCSLVVQEEIYAKNEEEAREIFRQNLEDGALTDIDRYIDAEEKKKEEKQRKYKIWDCQQGRYFAEGEKFDSLNEIREQLISYHSIDCDEDSLRKETLEDILTGFEWEVHEWEEGRMEGMIVIVKGNEADWKATKEWRKNA